MTYVGKDLAGWSNQLRMYISDERPLNLEEMRNLADVIDSVRAPASQIFSHVDRRWVPSWLQVFWNNLRVQIGVGV